MLEHKNLSLSPFKVFWDLKTNIGVVFVFSLFQLGITFVYIYIYIYVCLFHVVSFEFIYVILSRIVHETTPGFSLVSTANRPASAPFSGIGAAQAGGRGDEQHRGLREHEANSEPVMDMTPMNLSSLPLKNRTFHRPKATKKGVFWNGGRSPKHHFSGTIC